MAKKQMVNSEIREKFLVEKVSLEELYGAYLEKLILEKASNYTTTNLESIYQGFCRYLEIYCGKEYLEDVDLITNEVISSFIYHLEYEKGNKPTTINHKLARLHTMFKYGYRRKLCKDIPTNHFNRQRTTKTEKVTIKLEDYRKVLNSLDERYFVDGRTKFTIMWMWETGCRVGELWNCRLGDIDLKEKVWRIPRSKNNKARSVPLSSVLLKELDFFLSVRESTEPKTDFLVLTRNGKQLCKRILELNIKNAFEDNGVKGITSHNIRHTFISNMLNQKHVPVNILAEIVGNSAGILLATYAHSTLEDSKKFFS